MLPAMTRRGAWVVGFLATAAAAAGLVIASGGGRRSAAVATRVQQVDAEVPNGPDAVDIDGPIDGAPTPLLAPAAKLQAEKLRKPSR